MKKCTECNTEKEEHDFRKWRNKCKPCEYAYNQKYHSDNKKTLNPNKVSKNTERYREKRKYLVEYLKNNPCVDCGESRIACLEFDHVRGEKKDKISTLINYGWDTLKAEIDKCDVRCANCHAIVTAKRAGHWWADL